MNDFYKLSSSLNAHARMVFQGALGIVKPCSDLTCVRKRAFWLPDYYSLMLEFLAGIKCG